MAKKKDNTVEAAAEGQQPSELQAKLAKLEAENAALKKASPLLLPSFEVDDDAANDIEGGVYQFTAPALTWDDGLVIDVRKLAASEEKKYQALFAEICAKLVQQKSGLLKKVT
jgi:hypothetical protein